MNVVDFSVVDYILFLYTNESHTLIDNNTAVWFSDEPNATKRSRGNHKHYPW